MRSRYNYNIIHIVIIIVIIIMIMIIIIIIIIIYYDDGGIVMMITAVPMFTIVVTIGGSQLGVAVPSAGRHVLR